MYQLQIDNGIKKTAVDHAAERMKYEYDRFGLSNNRRESMIIIGTVGQLIFKYFLDFNRIIYKMEFQAGKYDNYDFQIKGQIIDIKTSGYDMYGFKHLNLLYAEDQYQTGQMKGYKFAVQIFIDGYDRNTKLIDLSKTTKGLIAGFIRFSEISNYKHERQYYGDDYKVPLSDLTSVDKLLKLLE